MPATGVHGDAGREGIAAIRVAPTGRSYNGIARWMHIATWVAPMGRSYNGMALGSCLVGATSAATGGDQCSTTPNSSSAPRIKVAALSLRRSWSSAKRIVASIRPRWLPQSKRVPWKW